MRTVPVVVLPVMDSNAMYRLDIPASALELYVREADAKHIPLADVVKARLRRCQHHKANKPLYFNDEERAQLEHLLSGPCETPQQAIRRIAEQACVVVGGVSIQLTDFDLRRIKARLRRDKPFEVNLQELISKLLQRYLQGEI